MLALKRRESVLVRTLDGPAVLDEVGETVVLPNKGHPQLVSNQFRDDNRNCKRKARK